jgi:FkbM family methyltransferase
MLMTSSEPDAASDYLVRLKGVNGWAILPSALKLPDGTPRFEIKFPANLADDARARTLVQGEIAGGYERATRCFVDRILRAGDLFIDVGGHWGYYTLLAATHPAGDIRVIAFEPDPENASILYANLLHNNVTRHAMLVCMACGDAMDLAPLVTDGNMISSVRGAFVTGGSTSPAKFVVVGTLDSALACFPHAAGGRVILKIDAEGYDAKVVAGAAKLLDTGRVALIIWEHIRGSRQGPLRPAILEMIESLKARGFRHLRPTHFHNDGPLLPFDPEADREYEGNVFACAPGLKIPI